MKMNMNSRGSISNGIAAGLQDLGSQPPYIGSASLAAHMTCERRVREDYIHECKVSRSRILTILLKFSNYRVINNLFIKNSLCSILQLINSQTNYIISDKTPALMFNK